jgi:tetratricopeptide (TPR) repeat protein/O-antigen ligase
MSSKTRTSLRQSNRAAGKQLPLSNGQHIISSLLVISYGYITVLTPNLMTLDSSGPKWLSLSILNLLGWFYILYQRRLSPKWVSPFNFFEARAGILYSALMLTMLLSFTQAINVVESFMTFAKLFTTFCAAWITSLLLIRNPRAITPLALGMTVLLLFDSLSVLKAAFEYGQGKINSISSIKAGYSNKNILAAALFIKLPFALWVLNFTRSWKKYLAIFVLVFALLAVLIMSARAFHLGLIFLSLLYLIFLVIRYRQTRERVYLNQGFIYGLSLILAFGLFTSLRVLHYPENSSGQNESVASQLSTVQKEAKSGNARLTFWGYTVDMIQENPVLGVGLGNWKINILKDENKTDAKFRYMLKAHNDFLEMASETGLPGGLIYLSVFIIIFGAFVKIVLRFVPRETNTFYFLSGLGIFAYSVDAFFNFPNDRPEIQSLFVLFIALHIAATNISKSGPSSKKPNPQKSQFKGRALKASVISLIILIGAGSTVLLALNFQSLRVQRTIRDELKHEEKSFDSEDLIAGFPRIPNLSAVSEPINVLIAKTLVKENKNEAILKLLKGNNHNPYDSRHDFYISQAYSNLGQLDSALLYAKKAYKLKPLYYTYTKHLANLLAKKKDIEGAIARLDSFLDNDRDKVSAWRYRAALYNRMGEFKNAVTTIDTALKYSSKDQILIELKREYLTNYYAPKYAQAIKQYNQKNYNKAIEYFEKAEAGYKRAGGFQSLPEFLKLWAHSHLKLAHNEKSKKLFLKLIENDSTNFFALMNLGNIAFHHDKDYDQATSYFKKCLSAENPDYWLSYKNLGTLYLIQKEKDKAIKYYEKALEYGNSKTVYKNLYLLWKEKNNRERMKHYQALINGLKTP